MTSTAKDYVLIFLLILLLSGCSNLMLIKLPKIPSLQGLQISNHMIVTDFKLDIPYKTFNKKIIYEFNPILIINSSDTFKLDSKLIYGEKAHGDESQVLYRYGGVFYHSDTIKYEGTIRKLHIENTSRVLTYGKDWDLFLPKEIIFKGDFSETEFK